MKSKILIIDDDDDMIEMFKMIFQFSGFDIVASNVGMFYHQIKELKPDLVLLDVNIIGFDVKGDEICRELKAHSDTENLPVFLVSAESNLSDIASRCNADDFICKPFDIFAFKSKVINELNAHRA